MADIQSPGVFSRHLISQVYDANRSANCSAQVVTELHASFQQFKKKPASIWIQINDLRDSLRLTHL